MELETRNQIAKLLHERKEIEVKMSAFEKISAEIDEQVREFEDKLNYEMGDSDTKYWKLDGRLYDIIIELDSLMKTVEGKIRTVYIYPDGVEYIASEYETELPILEYLELIEG